MRQKLFGVLMIGLVGLNYPVLSLFSKDSLFFQIPSLYLFLYSVWLLLIVLSGWIVEKR